MPVSTGDLDAAFQATGAADITAYGAVPGVPAAGDPRPQIQRPGVPVIRVGLGRRPDGATAAAWLQAGEFQDLPGSRDPASMRVCRLGNGYPSASFVVVDV
jgi:hypothetical protein